uniref:Uncharacterized protein n=1 Tax=Leersia perrieri TaxID=77586 RepID=A0A0D9XJJ3_9ORYZ
MDSSRNGDVTVTFEQSLFSGGHRRNAGFPTYLDLLLEDGDPPPPPPRRSLPPASRRRTYADGELDVFAAERYFKGAIDGGEYTPAAAAVVPAEISTAARPAVAVSRPAWTTRSSVASAASSSADSQTVLLRRDHRRRGGAAGKCCAQVGGILRSCSGKRSVHATPKSRIEWYRDLRMDKSGHRVAAVGLATTTSDVTHGVVAAPLPPNSNNLVAAGGRSLGRYFAVLAPAKVNGGGGDDVIGVNGEDEDEVGSESSSDLFEIKSLMIEDCPYEPSEASVQWSVVTASAAAVSVASSGRAPPIAGKGRRQERPVGGLLRGCVSHRAVDVSAMASVRRPPAAATARRRADVSRFASSGNL